MKINLINPYNKVSNYTQKQATPVNFKGVEYQNKSDEKIVQAVLNKYQTLRNTYEQEWIEQQPLIDSSQKFMDYAYHKMDDFFSNTYDEVLDIIKNPMKHMFEGNVAFRRVPDLETGNLNDYLIEEYKDGKLFRQSTFNNDGDFPVIKTIRDFEKKLEFKAQKPMDYEDEIHGELKLGITKLPNGDTLIPEVIQIKLNHCESIAKDVLISEDGTTKIPVMYKFDIDEDDGEVEFCGKTLDITRTPDGKETIAKDYTFFENGYRGIHEGMTTLSNGTQIIKKSQYNDFHVSMGNYYICEIDRERTCHNIDKIAEEYKYTENPNDKNNYSLRYTTDFFWCYDPQHRFQTQNTCHIKNGELIHCDEKIRHQLNT